MTVACLYCAADLIGHTTGHAVRFNLKIKMSTETKVNENVVIGVLIFSTGLALCRFHYRRRGLKR